MSDDMYLPSELKQKYHLSKFLGKGAFGEVRLAIKKRTQTKYAIKRILKQTNSGSSVETINDHKEIKTEIDILASFTYVSNWSVFNIFLLF